MQSRLDKFLVYHGQFRNILLPFRFHRILNQLCSPSRAPFLNCVIRHEFIVVRWRRARERLTDISRLRLWLRRCWSSLGRRSRRRGSLHRRRRPVRRRGFGGLFCGGCVKRRHGGIGITRGVLSIAGSVIQSIATPSIRLPSTSSSRFRLVARMRRTRTVVVLGGVEIARSMGRRSLGIICRVA